METSATDIRLYNLYRKDLKLDDGRAEAAVEIIKETVAVESSKVIERALVPIREDIQSLRTQMDIRFAQVESRMDNLEARMIAGFAAQDLKFNSKIENLEARMIAGFAAQDLKFATKEDLTKLHDDLVKRITITSFVHTITIIVSIVTMMALFLRK